LPRSNACSFHFPGSCLKLSWKVAPSVEVTVTHKKLPLPRFLSC
jgi:hypothetical protein